MKNYLKKIKKEISEELPHVSIEVLEEEECCIFINESKNKCCFVAYDPTDSTYKCQSIDVRQNNHANIEGFSQENKVNKLSEQIFKPLQITMLKEYII